MSAAVLYNNSCMHVHVSNCVLWIHLQQNLHLMQLCCHKVRFDHVSIGYEARTSGNELEALGKLSTMYQAVPRSTRSSAWVKAAASAFFPGPIVRHSIMQTEQSIDIASACYVLANLHGVAPAKTLAWLPWSSAATATMSMYCNQLSSP